MSSDFAILLLIFIDVFALVAILSICIHLLRKPKKQNLQMLQLAKDLNLELSQKKPGHPLQDMEGTYKGKIFNIYATLDPKVRLPRIRTVVIQLFGSNPLNLSFVIIRKTWVKNYSKTLGYQRLHFKDIDFDNHFIVHSNQPNTMYSIFTESIRAKFLAIKKEFDFKGGMQLAQNFMVYLEHSPIDTNYKRKRFEAITDLMSCLKDEIDNYFKTLQQ